MSSVTNNWQDIVELTDAIMAAAKNADWDELPDLAKKRDRLIREFFHNPPSNEQAARKRQQDIEQLLASDQEILKYSSASRDEIQAQIQTINTHKKAVKSYQACSK